MLGPDFAYFCAEMQTPLAAGEHMAQNKRIIVTGGSEVFKVKNVLTGGFVKLEELHLKRRMR